MDLFAYRETYPNAPGFKARKTASDAAAAIKPLSQTLRTMVLDTIRASDAGLTADEVARRLGSSILSVRPRVAELAAQNRIVDSGATRPNDSGRAAIVWRVA